MDTEKQERNSSSKLEKFDIEEKQKSVDIK